MTDLNSCLQSETAKIGKRPMGGNWHALRLDPAAAAAITAKLEAQGFVPMGKEYASLAGSSSAGEDPEWEYELQNTATVVTEHERGAIRARRLRPP